MAQVHGVPVLAVCETSSALSTVPLVHVPDRHCPHRYKFTERVQTDSFVYNELADPVDLVPLARPDIPDKLVGWENIESLKLLNLAYDVTPPECVPRPPRRLHGWHGADTCYGRYVTMVITEIGCMPCTSAPVVLRLKDQES